MFKDEWKKITSDSFILECIQGYKIPFTGFVYQHKKPNVSFNSGKDLINCENAIEKLLRKGAIRKCNYVKGQFLSSYFLVPKPDGDVRFILNLKDLNSYIKTEHFKLEDIRTACNLISKNSFMVVLDLQDAYLTVPIHKSYRKFLRFEFKGQIFEFLVLPFGLAPAPWVFTKITKPILRILRLLGYLSVLYLDDFLLIGGTVKECLQNLTATKEILLKLGFLVNTKKSSLIPTQRVNYLGFTIDSNQFIIELTDKRKIQVSSLIKSFIKKDKCSIEELASIIGSLIATCQAAKYGYLYTKILEREKILALEANNYNYNKKISVSVEMVDELKWWQQNINKNKKSLDKISSYDITIFTDASKTGWGATNGSNNVWGTWDKIERSHHINYLELLAIKNALLNLIPGKTDVNVLLRVDNTTAISYINKMGGVQHLDFLLLSRSIWQWAERRNIFLFASYIKSKENAEADRLSRIQNPDTEWALSPKVFHKITKQLGYPAIDLFATYQNAKCNRYISRYPERQAVETDAFTVNWASLFFYAFPPFAIILKTLRKIEEDGAQGILVVPDWPNQAWYPLFHEMLIQKPLHLHDQNLLSCPFRQTRSPVQKTNLIAGLVSARHLN